MKDIQPKYSVWFASLEKEEQVALLQQWANQTGGGDYIDAIKAIYNERFPETADRNIHSLSLVPLMVATEAFWVVLLDDRRLDPLNAKQSEDLSVKVIPWLCERAQFMYINNDVFHYALLNTKRDRKTVLMKWMTKWCVDRLEYLKKENKL